MVFKVLSLNFKTYVFSLNSNVKNKYIPNYQNFKRVTKLN